MNKVRLIGFITAILSLIIGLMSTRTDVHLFSGVFLGLGIGWSITGRFINNKKVRSLPLRSEEF